MPDLDVSFLTEDPMLCDVFTVTRRTDSISQRGRATPALEEVFQDLLGVVTQESPSDLLRDPDLQRVPRSICLITKFQVMGASTGRQPDVINWNGTDYLVTSVLPYSRFGEGTYEVLASSTVAVDDAQ